MLAEELLRCAGARLGAGHAAGKPRGSRHIKEVSVRLMEPLQPPVPSHDQQRVRWRKQLPARAATSIGLGTRMPHMSASQLKWESPGNRDLPEKPVVKG